MAFDFDINTSDMMRGRVFTNIYRYVLLTAGVMLRLSSGATAQDVINDTNVFIPSGLDMRIGGSLLNRSFFQNNGRLALEGDWINSSVYQGTGMVSFEGIDQRIANNNQGITHVAINGGGTKTLQGLLTVGGRLDFNNGILLVRDADTLTLDVACIVNTGSINSYVDGAIIAVGNGFKVFPVGKNGKYHPVTLENVRGIDPVQQMEVFEDLPAIQTHVPAIVKQDIYWERKTISGFFESTPINLGYDLQGTNLSRLVILEGDSIRGLFSVSDSVDISTSVDPNVTSSVSFLTRHIFALGEILVDPPKEYYLSTTLSPNADNVDNRSVKVFGDHLTPVDFSFQVFNRWGLMIFDTSSYEFMNTKGWEGTQNGSILPSGVYPYSIKFIDTSGRFSQQTGFITIIH